MHFTHSFVYNLRYDFNSFFLCPILDIVNLILIFVDAFLGAPTANGELCVGMQFSDRETVIQVIKSYSISKGVDYKVYESEPTIYYCKCVHYGIDYRWLLKPVLGGISTYKKLKNTMVHTLAVG